VQGIYLLKMEVAHETKTSNHPAQERDGKSSQVEPSGEYNEIHFSLCTPYLVFQYTCVFLALRSRLYVFPRTSIPSHHRPCTHQLHILFVYADPAGQYLKWNYYPEHLHIVDEQVGDIVRSKIPSFCVVDFDTEVSIPLQPGNRLETS
jgi:hypothetical protein